MEIKEILSHANNLIKSRQFDLALEYLDNTKVNQPEIYNVKGIIYMNKNQPDKALEMYNKCLELAKTNNREVAFFYSNRSFAYLRLGKIDKAIDDVKKALSMSSNESKLYDLLSNLYVSKGDYKKALEILDDGLKQLPGNATLIKKRGTVIELSTIIYDPYSSLLDSAMNHHKQKEPRIALQILKRAQEFGETYEFYELQSRCYWDLEKHDQGYTAISKAIELVKDNDKKAEFYWVKAKYCHTLNKGSETIEYCQSAINLNKSNPQFYYDLAFYLMIERNTKDALKNIDHALKLKATHPLYYVRKGDILSHMGQLTLADQMYEKAIELDPLNKLAYERRLALVGTKKYGVGDKMKKKNQFVS